LDEYSKSGPKNSKSAARQREREKHAQMSDLLAIGDEETLVSVLKSQYKLTPKDPSYTSIMKIWRDAQLQLRHER
jgi:hypothetical protein